MDYSLIGGAIDDYVNGTGVNNYGLMGGYTDTYASPDATSSGSNFGGLNLGNLTNVLGRLGAGIGTGIASYQTGQQSAYIPYTRWLGNGLAQTGFINNMQNKQNQLDRIAGAGSMLGNMKKYPYTLFGGDNFNNTNNTYGYGTVYDEINRQVGSPYNNVNSLSWR